MLRPLTREDELKQQAEDLERDLTCSDYELELNAVRVLGKSNLKSLRVQLEHNLKFNLGCNKHCHPSIRVRCKNA